MVSEMFESSFAGVCADCRGMFTKGEMVRFNDENKIIGEDCCGIFYDTTDYEDGDAYA